MNERVNDDTVRDLRALLSGSAEWFAARRPDVASARVSWPRRGLEPDEAGAFLRAVEVGFAAVDEAGFVTLPRVRAKKPVGRYSLLSKNGDGVAVNLEYLIQIGAAAELALDHGWPADALDFERGEFDVLGYHDGRVVLAVEAKARVDGPDGLARLLRSWASYDLRISSVPDNNAGRKYRELLRLAGDGPVVLWLVASGARWTFLAEHGAGGLTLTPLDCEPTYDRAGS